MRSISKNPLPRWRGFNLIEKLSTEDVFLKYIGSRKPSFQETDFQWISDWGFDFVRIPMSYRCWSSPGHWLDMDESVLAQVDEAVEFGRRYGLHVSLNLHRAPGYCVNMPPEPQSLWTSPDALAAAIHHWCAFAKRYSGIPANRLSFDLLNEPPAPCDSMGRADYERVIRALTGAIREIDPARLIIADGLNWGNDPVPELAGLGIAQSCRAYLPMGITHYKAPWVGGSGDFPSPKWPGGEHYGQVWDRARMEAHYAKWGRLIEQGVGVHCGEGGCYSETPHAVFLSWFEDVLEILTGLGIGYALWNFRGSFGVLDSRRRDIDYKDWHGHSLDENLLKLLQKY